MITVHPTPEVIGIPVLLAWRCTGPGVTFRGAPDAGADAGRLVCYERVDDALAFLRSVPPSAWTADTRRIALGLALGEAFRALGR